jgi:hypothetical protein
MDIGDAALSAVSGAGEGFSQGIANATNIKQMQAMDQNQAIKGFEFKKAQAEEERLNKPLYKEDIAKKIPAEFQGSFFDSTKDKWQKGADGREFMPTRDMAEYKETLGNFDKHQMLNGAMQYLAKEDEKLTTQFTKNSETLQSLANEFTAKQADLKKKAKDDPQSGAASKLIKLQNDWKERLQSGDMGNLVKETQGLNKQLSENKQKRGMYQAKLTGAEDSVKKIMESHPGIDPNKIMAAWGGDKDAQAEIQAIVLEDKKKAAGAGTSFQEKGVTEKGGDTVSYDPKEARNFVTRADGVREPYDPKKHGKILSTTQSQTNISINGGGGFGKLAPDDKNIWFEQYKTTGKIPPFQFRDTESRNAFTKGYAEYLRANGETNADAQASRVALKAQGMAMNAAKKMDAAQGIFINKIEENTKTLERIRAKYGSNFQRWANLPLNKAQEFIGSGDLAAIKLVLKSTSNEVAKVESGSLGIQEVSEGQAKYMKMVHDENLPFAEIMKVMNMGNELGANARRATKKQIQDLDDEIKGKKPPSTKKAQDPSKMSNEELLKALGQ